MTSPQGWASDAAEAVDGKVLERVDAHGKHLLYRFEDDLTVHVHLGLFGKFRRYKLPGPPARDTTRLRFIGEERGMDLAGADDLAADRPGRGGRADGAAGARSAPPARARRPLAHRPGPAQVPGGRRSAGPERDRRLGNIYRAEILFACGIDPHRESRSLSGDEVDAIWATSKKMLAYGEKTGKIVTVPRAEAAGPLAKLTGRDRHQVYKREHCNRCGTAVRSETMAAAPCSGARTARHERVAP